MDLFFSCACDHLFLESCTFYKFFSGPWIPLHLLDLFFGCACDHLFLESCTFDKFFSGPRIPLHLLDLVHGFLFICWTCFLDVRVTPCFGVLHV